MLRFTPHVRASSHTLAGCGAAAVALRRATARSTDWTRCVARGFRGTPSAARSTLIVRILNRVGRRELAGRRPLYRGRRRRGNDAAPDVGRLALSSPCGHDVRIANNVYLTRGRWRGIIAPSAGRRKHRPVRHSDHEGSSRWWTTAAQKPASTSTGSHSRAASCSSARAGSCSPVAWRPAAAAAPRRLPPAAAARRPPGRPRRAATSASASRAAARATSSTARASSPSPTRPA